MHVLVESQYCSILGLVVRVLVNLEHIVSWNDKIMSVDPVQLTLDEFVLLFCHLFWCHGRLQLLESPLALCFELLPLNLCLLKVVSLFCVVNTVPLGVLLGYVLRLHEELAGLALSSYHFLRTLPRYSVCRPL